MDKYLIDGHKLYWHLDRLSSWQKERLIPPVYLEVSPVGYCNHKCLFCGIDFAMQNKTQLKTEIFCKRLEESGKLGVKSIMFAGEGEPFLHNDFAKLVSAAKNSGMDISITTNGTVGSRETFKEILPCLTWIRFSVDAGEADIYAKVHNVDKAYFVRALDNIEGAVKTKKDDKLNVTIGIQFLIIDENLGDIENAIKLFSCMGVDYISLKPYSLHPKMIKKRDTIYTAQTMQHIEGIVARYKSKDTNIIFRKDAMDKYVDKEKGFNRCRALPFWGYVSCRGDFYTCSVFIGDERFKAGNIYDNDMQSIIFGSLRKESILYAENKLDIAKECRLNCRMARVNEFLEFLEDKPEHVNFI